MWLRTLVLCLFIFCFFSSSASVQAQESRLAPELGFDANAPKIIAAGGLLFPRPGPSCLTPSSPAVEIYAAEAQFPLGGSLAGRLHAAYSFVGRPWMGPPVQAEGQPLASGEAIEFLFKLVLPVRVLPRLVVEPYVGGGASRLLDVGRDEIEGEAVLLEAATDPLLTYGGSLGYQLTERVELHAQVQGMLIFAGDQGFIPPGEERFEDDAGRISGAEVFLGFGFRL